ncbi:MAG: 23S rRNA (adenine(2503)-C(2))-methyltransferase RlmN [Coriobacteriia bacterium]|nr:23S rRNA (adenine(2503)-C(2))-methyltransferase RlmN [Coriobacteriia bacterium]
MNTPITICSSVQIKDFLKEIHQPAFRYKQIIEWLFIHRATSYDQMTNLPKALRDEFAEHLPLYVPKLHNRRVSQDGTRKYLFELHDGQMVETVAIPSHGSKDRLTVCFSTQVGCAMGCMFCATGHEGFTRNLGMAEIVYQILLAEDDMGMRVSNLVGMGQGEPFLNFQNVLDALLILNDPKGIGIGARKITVSTCGVIPGIQKFQDVRQQFTMAVSLHSAIQEKRDQIMPKARKWPLHQLKRALREYLRTTDRRITFEYLLINGVNDGEEDLKALIDYCDGLLCHVNLLNMNAIEGSPFKPTGKKTIDAWLRRLESAGIEATLRTSRGSDIEGACGQLKNALS